jgi:hypothetical protein
VIIVSQNRGSSKSTHNNLGNCVGGDELNNTKWAKASVVRTSSKKKRPNSYKIDKKCISVANKGNVVDAFVQIQTNLDLTKMYPWIKVIMRSK